MLRPRFFTLFSSNETSRPDPAAQKAGTYKYIIDWSHGDCQYKAHCPKFPDISYLAGTREAALAGAKHLVASAISN